MFAWCFNLKITCQSFLRSGSGLPDGVPKFSQLLSTLPNFDLFVAPNGTLVTASPISDLIFRVAVYFPNINRRWFWFSKCRLTNWNKYSIPRGYGEQSIFRIRTSVFRETRVIVALFVQGILSSTMALGDSEMDLEKLLIRESIIRHTKREFIKKNKNIDFNNLSQMKVVLGESSVECFFGYQNKQRLILCF